MGRGDERLGVPDGSPPRGGSRPKGFCKGLHDGRCRRRSSRECQPYKKFKEENKFIYQYFS